MELLHHSSQEWIVQSPTLISEQTQVYFDGSFYTGSGRIRSCFRDTSCFVLTIAMSLEECFVLPRHEFDPGLLEVDSFLTEEEETKILDSLNNDIPCSLTVQRLCSELTRVSRKMLGILLPATCS